MMWEDVAMAALLSLGLWGQWSLVFDRRTVYPLNAALTKGASALGLGLLQLSIGLWITALVSGAHVAAFTLLALLRRPEVP